MLFPYFVNDKTWTNNFFSFLNYNNLYTIIVSNKILHGHCFRPIKKSSIGLNIFLLRVKIMN